MNALTFDRVSEDLDRMALMSCALEAYQEILHDKRFDPSNSVGLALQVGLEAIDPTINVKEGTAVTLRVIKDGIVKLAKMTRQALKLLFDFIQSMYVKFTGSLGMVRRRHKLIGNRIGKLGRRTTYSKLKVTGISRLSIDGRFVGADASTLSEIRGVVDFILNTYPKAVANTSRDCARKFQNLVENAKDEQSVLVAKLAIEAFDESLGQRLVVPASFTKADTKELPSSMTGNGVMRSPHLPGNYAMLLDMPQRTSGGDVNNYATLIANAFTFKFTELSLNAPDNTEREIDVPSIQDLNLLYTGINDILSLAERGESGRREYATVKVLVDDAINQISERSGELSNTNNVLIHMLGAMSKKLAEPVGTFLHWLAVTLNVYLGFMDHCIAHYSAEGV